MNTEPQREAPPREHRALIDSMEIREGEFMNDPSLGWHELYERRVRELGELQASHEQLEADYNAVLAKLMDRDTELEALRDGAEALKDAHRELKADYERLRKAATEFLKNSCYTGHEDWAQALRAALAEGEVKLVDSIVMDPPEDQVPQAGIQHERQEKQAGQESDPEGNSAGACSGS